MLREPAAMDGPRIADAQGTGWFEVGSWQRWMLFESGPPWPRCSGAVGRRRVLHPGGSAAVPAASVQIPPRLTQRGPVTLPETLLAVGYSKLNFL